MTAVGIPARPVKKDGVAIPRERGSVRLDEYEEMKTRVNEMEQELIRLRQALEETKAASCKTEKDN